MAAAGLHNASAVALPSADSRLRAGPSGRVRSLSAGSSFKGSRVQKMAPSGPRLQRRGASRGLQCRAKAGVSSRTRLEEWEKARTVLLSKIRSVTPEEAVTLVQDGKYKILDVRTEQEYDDVRPEGSVNAQIYRQIKNWTAWDIARRAGFAFFGVFNGTEDNPDFLEDVSKVARKDDGLIVACMMGGTLKPSANFPTGRESRSLNAAYKLVLEGYTNVLHLEGGLATYFREDHPVIFKDD